jgi:hypothetical protein
LEKGADRLAVDNDMRTPVDLVDTAKWKWDEEGLVREKPKPVSEMVNNPMRGGGGRGRGRYMQNWTRGSSRGNQI